jgi:hypothetical protein
VREVICGVTLDGAAVDGPASRGSQGDAGGERIRRFVERRRPVLGM